MTREQEAARAFRLGQALGENYRWYMMLAKAA